MLGPLLGAAVLAVADWRAIFWLNVVLGVVLAAAIRVTGGSPSRRSHPTRPGHGARRPGPRARPAHPARPRPADHRGHHRHPVHPAGGQLARGDADRGPDPGAGRRARGWSPPAGGGPCCGRADAPGAVLVAVALGSLVLTFASADPRARGRRPLGPRPAARRCGSGGPLPVARAHGRTPARAARRRPWPGAGRPAGQPPRRRGPGDRRRRRAAARAADPDRLADHGRPGAGAVPGRGARRRPARRCAAAAARPRRGRRAGPGARRRRARRHGDLGPGLARGGARHGGAGRWSGSAPAWPSPPSTPPRSPTPRRRPTVSPARWSSSPAWSAWWWGWPC